MEKVLVDFRDAGLYDCYTLICRVEACAILFGKMLPYECMQMEIGELLFEWQIVFE